VEVALRRDRTSEEYLKTLLSVETQTANLRKIVEMLLVLTREPMGAGDPEFESFELNAWLDQHIASWRSHPRIGDLRVDSGSSDQLWVKAHTGLLGQVVDNLWDNACKFSTPKSPITIRTTRSAGDVKLMVEDVGLGIAAHEVARVADPFYRSEEARTRGIAGTGLGLAIAKRILGALNARLDIESVIGRGSIFTIVFRPTAR
jgi:signal transduction histidine kinase